MQRPSQRESRPSSSNSTPQITPTASALPSALASPTAPLSRAASPFTRRDSSKAAPDPPSAVVDDDTFAPASTLKAESYASNESNELPRVVAEQSDTAIPLPPANTSLSTSLGETLVISGGSGYNELLGATPGNTTYVMPISDNGGSSSEIIRTLSGPSIGDIRSRLVRLIPLTTSPRLQGRPIPPKSNDALHALLSYRLPTAGRTRDIKAEWLDLLEGKHRLWRGIEADRKEVVRGFLVHFQSEILRRAHRNFNLRGLSVGNAFLSAAQKFFRSIQSAIFLFSATTLVAGTGSSVLPCINTNHTATIAAELENGSNIVGQCEISHPARPAQAKSTKRPRQQFDGHLSIPGVNLDDLSAMSSTGVTTPASVIFDPLANIGSDLAAALSPSREDQPRRLHDDHPTLGRRTVGTLQDGLDPDDTEASQPDVNGDDDEDSEGESSVAAGNLLFSKAGESGEAEEPLPSRIKSE